MTQARTQLAIEHIMLSCASAGAFQGTSAVNKFVLDTAAEVSAARSRAFPDRYAEHVAYAMQVVATNCFTSPPAAVASVYLATRFEYYFRVLSGRLKGDGTWVSKADQNAVRTHLSDRRLGLARVSSVSLAYKVMMLDGSRQLSQACACLDAAMYKTPHEAGESTIADLGDRIEFGRHAAGHGEWGDVSSEGLFYGLKTSLVFYNQN